MKLFILLSFVASSMGTAALGLQLVLSGMKSRKAPEFAYGASLLFAASGAVTRLVVVGVFGGGAEYLAWLTGAAVVRLLTLVALAWGIKVIFRARDSWSWALVLALWCFGLWSVWLVAAFPDGVAEVGSIYYLADFPAVLATLWGALESFSYYAKMRRRCQLGLADPLMTQRFKLWGIAFSCGAVAGLLLVGAGMVTGGAVTELPLILALIQALMLGVTLMTWWAFYPPQWLRRRVMAA
jgi:hypothetical protein